MLPEVLRGNASHPFLEQLRESCDDGVNVSFSVPGERYFYGLNYYLIAAVGLPQGAAEQYGRIESQGEYRGATGGLCGPPEKVDVGGSKPQNSLVRDESDCPALAKGTGRSLHGLGVVNNCRSESPADPIQVRIEQGVCHATSDHVEWYSASGDISCEQLPVAMMAGDEHHA